MEAAIDTSAETTGIHDGQSLLLVQEETTQRRAL